jgi:putative ABC transport system permease protein
MASIPKWHRYLRFWGNNLDEDVADEFRFHLETEIDELVARGMSPDDARADALRRFGDVAYYREYCRRADKRRTTRQQRGRTFDVLAQDVRYAFRSLLKHPSFAAIAVLTLGLGIGANTAIFSVLNAVVLTPLPYREPDRLVLLWESMRGAPQIMVSYPDYLDWRARTHSFEDIAIYNGYDSFNYTGNGEPVRLSGGLASGNLFSVLGLKPEVGRLIGPADDRADAPPVAVISHQMWARLFASDRAAVGRTIKLDGFTYTIIGVLPPTFAPNGLQLWLPIGRFTNTPRFARENHPGLTGVGRLKAGVTLDQMRRDLADVMRQVGDEYPAAHGIGASGDFISEIVVGQIKPALILITGAVTLVLLVACANVANLLLGRAASRQREFGLRVAIGAGRRRIVRQLLTESIVLALLGGLLGVGFAWAGTRLLVSLRPGNIPRLTEIVVNSHVLAFALGISVLTGILFGLVPALQATRSDPIDALRDGGRAFTPSRARVRATLTVAEVALALVLLVGAGLLLRSFANLLGVDTGFDKRNVVVALVQLPERRYPQEKDRAATFDDIISRVRALPGVATAALTTDLPINSTWQMSFGTEESTDAGPLLSAATVSPEYFGTLHVSMLSGRDFAPSDRQGQPRVAIVSRTAARRLFNSEDVVGRRLREGRGPAELTIVGIVKDVKNEGLQRAGAATVYFPSPQRDLPSAWLVVRSASSPEALAPALRRVIASIDTDLPLSQLQSLDETINSTIAQPKFSLVMLGIFACVALALAAIGLYGVISYNVSQRTSEIGVRIALGAQRGDVVRLVVGQGMTLALVGIFVGGLAALASGKVIAEQLFDVQPSDPGVFAVVATTLLAIALVASVIPALRATRIDPADAMRRAG